MAFARDIKEMLTEAVRQGWRVEDNHKHYKLFSPDGRSIVMVSRTPSDPHAFANAVSDLRRRGFRWKGR